MSRASTKVIEFEEGNLLVKYPMRRKVNAKPTLKTPPPAESVLQIDPGLPAFDTPAYWEYLKAKHARLNP